MLKRLELGRCLMRCWISWINNYKVKILIHSFLCGELKSFIWYIIN